MGQPFTAVYLPEPSRPDQRIALHCVAPDAGTHQGVLFIHGSTFPTLLAAGYEFRPGDSWMRYMASHGFLSCGLDFLGFGASSRPVEMAQPPEGKSPLLRAQEAALEIAAAISHMRQTLGITQAHIVAHSWGTIPAAGFAATHPREVASLTLFGPLVPIQTPKPGPVQRSWWSITAQQRLQQLYFTSVLPPGLVMLEAAVTDKWAAEFAASGPHVDGDMPGELRVPSGPVVDIEEARAGTYPYLPDKVIAPILAVYGNYDTEASTPCVESFLAGFAMSPLKWQLCINDGSHVMHLERNRHSLYESVLSFIRTAEGFRRTAQAD